MDLWYLNGARYYDPSLKRFITPDTIVQSPYDPQSLNRYAYCRNNPLKLVDPTGHEWGYAETGGEYDWFETTNYFSTDLNNPLNLFANFSGFTGNLGLNALGYTSAGINWLENKVIVDLLGGTATDVEAFNAATMYFGATGQLAAFGQSLKASATYTKALIGTELSGEGYLANEIGSVKLLGQSSNTGKALQTYYPPNEGFAIGKSAKETLQQGALFDRYGITAGKYGSPVGTPFEMRSLPGTLKDGPYNIYEVLKPLDATTGPATSWFGQIGLGPQYKFSQTVEDLLGLNIIKRVGP